MVSESSTFDASRFNDPIAMQTEWTPLKSGGSNFRTHKLVRINNDRIEFKASWGAKLFYGIFILAGFGAMIAFSYQKIGSGDFGMNIESLFPLLIGLGFSIAGGAMLYFGTIPIVFDKRFKSFWKGRKSPNMVYDKEELKAFIKLEDIHAIQLISEYISGKKSSYYSYELNLVLKDASRINVIDHGNDSAISSNAKVLSRFLDVPVWDAI
jgi:hypothetical protein